MNLQQPKYKLSPSLIKSFIDFYNETGYEKEGEQIPFVTYDSLMGRINKVPTATGEKAEKGNRFESAVFGEATDEFDPNIVSKIRSYMPKHVRKQEYVEYHIKELNMLFYGYCDAVGGGKVYDIKTTAFYEFPHYLTHPQNLYLLALKDYGVSEIQYLITNFKDVYKECYGLDFNFSKLYEYIEIFCHFLEVNRGNISNLDVFNQGHKMPFLDSFIVPKIAEREPEYILEIIISHKMNRDDRRLLEKSYLTQTTIEA